ncbi:hypothetical protein GGR56DRAFT_693639 [Xylariaceae sp. FL0804]|nr:hypothetical protein GGR56DRAFT_693639 [Xylariaceae sp. FL0804]
MSVSKNLSTEALLESLQLESDPTRRSNNYTLPDSIALHTKPFVSMGSCLALALDASCPLPIMQLMDSPAVHHMVREFAAHSPSAHEIDPSRLVRLFLAGLTRPLPAWGRATPLEHKAGWAVEDHIAHFMLRAFAWTGFAGPPALAAEFTADVTVAARALFGLHAACVRVFLEGGLAAAEREEEERGALDWEAPEEDLLEGLRLWQVAAVRDAAAGGLWAQIHAQVAEDEEDCVADDGDESDVTYLRRMVEIIDEELCALCGPMVPDQ